jgi:hypothetical protein
MEVKEKLVGVPNGGFIPEKTCRMTVDPNITLNFTLIVRVDEMGRRRASPKMLISNVLLREVMFVALRRKVDTMLPCAAERTLSC